MNANNKERINDKSSGLVTLTEERLTGILRRAYESGFEDKSFTRYRPDYASRIMREVRGEGR